VDIKRLMHREAHHLDDLVERYAQRICIQYLPRLIRVARQALGNAPMRAEDEEDAAQSALHSFFRGVRDGRLTRLHHDENVWPLLYRITVRKAINVRNRQLSKKRGRGNVRGDSVLDRPGDIHTPAGLDRLEARVRSHESIIDARDQYEQMLRRLDSDALRDVAELKLQGYTNAEIAERLGVVERTVERRLRAIRRQASGGPTR
jgi:RNA polymerase sigma factor (sigma-70 family)